MIKLLPQSASSKEERLISLTSVSIVNFSIQQVKVGTGVDLHIHMLGSQQHCTRGDCADRELDRRKKVHENFQQAVARKPD